MLFGLFKFILSTFQNDAACFRRSILFLTFTILFFKWKKTVAHLSNFVVVDGVELIFGRQFLGFFTNGLHHLFAFLVSLFTLCSAFKRGGVGGGGCII